MKFRLLLAFLLSIVAGLQTIKAQTSYDVWLAGTRVTSENRNNVLGDGTVSYDTGTNTLTLKNANITADEAYGLHSKMPLNIKLEGENRISVVWKSAVFFQKGSTNGTVTILGYGSLIVTSDYTPIIAQLDLVIKNGAKLTLKSSGDYTGINGLSNGTRLPTLTLQGIGTELKAKGGSPGSLTDFSALNLSDGITIKEPAGATFTPNVGVVKNGALVINDWVVIAGSEPYACYTSSNTTLTFYCDKLRSSRTGTTYDLNAGTNNTGWETDGTNDNVTKVVFDPSFADARPTTTYSWFYEMRNLQTITGMEYLNTSEVTNMGWMFANCQVLKVLDLSNFNTTKVTEMSYMFFCSNQLSTIYVGNEWSTAAVTDSGKMFYNCTSLVGGQGTTYDENHIDASYAHIDGGTSNPGYFTDKNAPESYACYTSGNTTLTFYYDNLRSSRSGTTYDLNTDDLPAWYNDGTKTSVTKAVFDASFANARPTSTHSWFDGMKNLQAITGISYLNTSEVVNMSSMFYGCSSLTSLNLSHFNVEKVSYMDYMFSDCTALTSLDLSNLNASSVTDMSGMFENCSSLTNLNLTNFRIASGGPDMDEMFYHCSSLTSLDLTSFKIGCVERFGYMFAGCSNLQTIYVSEWDPGAADTWYMFEGCTSLVGGSGTTFSAGHVDALYAHIDGGAGNPGYFTANPHAPTSYVCYTPSNTTLTFYHDTQRGTRTGTTYSLEAIDGDFGSVSEDEELCHDKWDWHDEPPYSEITQVVFDPSFADARPQTAEGWFSYMKNLQTISGMEYLNTCDVVFMKSMFRGCSSLRRIDLTNFDTGKVRDMSDMFRECTNLKTIYAGDGWSTASVTSSSSMFYKCTQLVGGQGTTYDENHIDASYAQIDGGPSNPGYLTDKNSAVYNLWIAGIQVTEKNRNNLTELVAASDDGEMEITFDGDQTLILKNANIQPETGVYGIQSKLQNLDIKLIGENTITATNSLGVYLQKHDGEGATTFLGDGSLSITSNSGAVRTLRNVVIKDGAKITAESTGDAPGLQGRPAVYGGDGPTLTMQGKGTMLKAKGGSVGSLMTFKELNLSDGLAILEPVGATFESNVGVVLNGRYVTNEWVVIGRTLLRGDVNLDGTVDIADAVSVLNAMAGQPVAGDANVNGDYDANGNPVIDIADLVTVLNIMAGQ